MHMYRHTHIPPQGPHTGSGYTIRVLADVVDTMSTMQLLDLFVVPGFNRTAMLNDLGCSILCFLDFLFRFLKLLLCMFM